MKKYIFLAVAAVTLLFVSCQKNELHPSEPSGFELIANIAKTKTTLSEDFKVDWEEGDVLYMVTSDGTWGKPYNDDKSAASIAEFKYESGKFSTTSLIDPATYIFKAMYATEDQKSFHRGASSTHKLNATQSQNCADPTAEVKKNDALVGTFEAKVPMSKPAEVNMQHLYTLMRVDIKNATGASVEVKSFEMTATGADLAAVFNVVAFDTPSLTTKQDASETITVNLAGGTVDNDASLPVYFVMAPLTNYTGDVTFKVTDSANKTYTKTVKMSGISFEAGHYNTTPYTISVADAVEPEQPGQPDGATYYEKVSSEPTDWSGKYLIVYEDGEDAYVFNGKDEASDYVSAKISDNKIAVTDALTSVEVQVETMTDGYSIKTANGYIYGKSGENKLLFDTNTAQSNTIKLNSDGDVAIVSNTSVFRFNSASNNLRFRYFKSTTYTGQKPVYMYKLNVSAAPEVPVEPDTTPSVKLETEELELIAEESEGTIKVEVKNIASIEVRALDEEGGQDDSDWLVAEYDEANACITYCVPANESEEPRTAYIEVYCLDAAGNEIVDFVKVTQKGIATEPAGPQVVTVAEFLAATANETVLYQLTGTIKNIADATWGNFTIEDSTASVYIYGLTKEQNSSNDKSFASIGLRVGDEVTLITVRGEFNGEAQGGGSKSPAYYVSHVAAPYFELKETTGSVAYDATTFTVHFESNLSWTATHSTGVSLNATSGNGNGSVEVTFAANETEENKKHTVTFTAGDITAVFTLTQTAKPAEGEDADPAWTLVTDVNELVAGDQIVIVAKNANYAMSTTQNSNNRAQAAVTKTGNIITFGSGVQVLTLYAGKSSGTFAFNTGSGYLYAASSSKNYLKTETTLSANSSWKIEITSAGVATIKAQGSNTRNWLRYNSSNNPPIFACYSSGQTDVCIYKLK